MNIIDLRKKLLQSSTEQRLSADRRKVSYLFGSAEWLEYIKTQPLECPNEDRRKTIRRQVDRNVNIAPQQADTHTNYQRIHLTAGERRLLQDIYLTDFDES